MAIIKTILTSLAFAALCVTILCAQKPPLRSATARYLASEDGRAWLEASGHPLSKYLNQAFGEPSRARRVEAARNRLSRTTAAASEPSPQASVPCNGATGARFNLEPRANALPQQSEAADFILNGVGAGQDLIVQSANDYRGNVTSANWDGSLSGYYVHRAAPPTAACSLKADCQLHVSRERRDGRRRCFGGRRSGPRLVFHGGRALRQQGWYRPVPRFRV